MPEWLDAALFGATLPFRAATEAVLFVPTIAATAIAETIETIRDSDHKWDATRHYKEVRDIYGKAAVVGLGVGAIFATGGIGPVLAGVAATYKASNINQKCEKILVGCSSSEEVNLRLGMLMDGCGIVGTAADIRVLLGLLMKFTPDAIRKYQKMSPAEQSREAAAIGISLFKFQQLIE